MTSEIWQLDFSILSTFLVCHAYSMQKLFMYWPVLLSFDPLLGSGMYLA